jgi:hypothetical protein
VWRAENSAASGGDVWALTLARHFFEQYQNQNIN